MDKLAYSSFVAEMEKRALIERLIRLAATDVPKTPRLLMKKRSPGQLKALQGGVESFGKKNVTDPIMRVAEKGITKLPAGKLQDTVRAGAKVVAKDPIGAVATAPIPVPGAQVGYFKGKQLLERGIDKAFPLPGK